MILNENILDKFDIDISSTSRSASAPAVPGRAVSTSWSRVKMTSGFQKICLDTLSQLITSEQGFVKLNKIFKNKPTETKQFINKLQSFISDTDKEYYIAVCIFVANICIYEPELVVTLNLRNIPGGPLFDFLDEKNEKIMLKRLNCAYNYYGIGTNITTLENFIVQVEKRIDISRNSRLVISNLLYISMKAMKNYTLKDRVKSLTH